MGVDAGGWPTNVAPNELIESAWGNAVVKGLLGVPVGAGVNAIGPHIQGAIGNILHTAVSPVLTYATRLVISASCWAGSDSSGLGGIQFGILTNVAGANGPQTPQVATQAGGTYGHANMPWSYVVPAGGSPEFAVTAAWTTGSGTVYTAAQVTWVRYRS